MSALPELGSVAVEQVADPESMVKYWEERLSDDLRAVHVAQRQLDYWYRERILHKKENGMI